MVMGPYFQERANVFKNPISAYQKSKLKPCSNIKPGQLLPCLLSHTPPSHHYQARGGYVA